MHSDVYEIRVGPNLKPFYIHSGILAELSEEMRRVGFVYKEARNGGKIEVVEMKEVSEDTMRYFFVFCHSGDYNVHSWLEGREKALAHARLYAFAKRYKIEAAQELAMGKLGEFIANRAIDTASVMTCLLEYDLGNTPEEEITDRLVGFLERTRLERYHSK